MAMSAFDDKSKRPTAGDIKKTLGRTNTHWNSLITHIASEYKPLDQNWQFSGASWGWALQLKWKKRAVLYMTPCKGHFLAGLVLGEKAVKAAHDSDLPDSILAVMDGAKKYVEGRAIRIEVRSKKDCDVVKKLAAIKMAN